MRLVSTIPPNLGPASNSVTRSGTPRAAGQFDQPMCGRQAADSSADHGDAFRRAFVGRSRVWIHRSQLESTEIGPGYGVVGRSGRPGRVPSPLESPHADLVHHFHEGFDHFRIGFGENAVAQVENVSRPSPGTVQHVFRLRFECR